MRIIVFVASLLLTATSYSQWRTNFQDALSEADSSNKLVLLNFSGSDWCGPCIRMKKEIFESSTFLKLADSTLVLVDADFPRNRKNQLPKLLQQQNDELAGRYNSSGKFPFTLLIDSGGKVIKTWEGLPGESPGSFCNEIKKTADAYRNQ